MTHSSGRPPAPDFQFGPRGSPDAHIDDQVTVAPPELRARVTCPRCGTASDAGLRYCVSCGFAMDAPAQASPLAATYALDASRAQNRTNDASVAGDPAANGAGVGPVIAPLRVVSLSGPETPAQSVRVCARCRGACDAQSQYCRFCGAPLADIPIVPSAAIPTPLRPPSLSSVVAVPAITLDDVSAPRTDPVPPPLSSSDVPRVEDPELRHPRERADASANMAASLATGGRGAMASTSQLHGFAIPDAPAVAVHEWSPKVRVVVVARDGGEGPSYPVGEQLDVGRLEGHVVIAEDRYLSPRHARIVRRDGRLVLRDLGSTNGIYLRLRSPRGGDGAEGHGPTPGTNADERSGATASATRARASAAGGGSADSSGGTTEGGTHLTTHALKDQDLFLVGQQVLRFEVVNDAFDGLGPAAQHGTLLFGTPASPRYARLSQRTVEGVTRDVFYIRKAETVLGRESGDIVFTEDPFLSRRHAVIRTSGPDMRARAGSSLVEHAPRDASGGDAPLFLLEDLGSSNGTFIQLRGEVTLQSGDQFRIGQQLFRIDIA